MATKSESLSVVPAGTLMLGGELQIHRLGFGCLHLTGQPGDWGPPKNIIEGQEVLRKAVQAGINFLDTADSYGPAVSENLISETLYPYNQNIPHKSPKIVVATKGGFKRPGPNEWIVDGRPEYLKRCVEESLKRLRLECIDLYQLHQLDPNVDPADSLGALKEMQDEGKIRFIGLSNVNITEIQYCQKIVDIVSIQNLYNLSNRESEPVLKYCEEHALAFIPWFPLGSGGLLRSNKKLEKVAKEKGATPAQIAIAWLLQKSPVMVPIPGTSSVKHLEENIKAASLTLSKEEFDLLSNE